MSNTAASYADSKDHNDPSAPEPQSVYHLYEDGSCDRPGRRIRTTDVDEKLDRRIAERRGWAKFGLEEGKPAGPSSENTSVGENVIFIPSVTSEATHDKKVSELVCGYRKKCRYCESEDHFTARCPFKEELAPADETTCEATGATVDDESFLANSSKFGWNVMATLRVTNVCKLTVESELQEIFQPFGRISRVLLPRDRKTGRARGFAFIIFENRADAQLACNKLDGTMYEHLKIQVEFVKQEN